MGREIRKVPKNWEHPKDENGHLKPVHDEEFDIVAKKWIEEFIAWENGTHPNKKSHDCFYWEYTDNPPEREYYRQKFSEEANCFQIYETVTEGTPVSPIFETKDEMRIWLIYKGYSEHAAQRFIEEKRAPSMVGIFGNGLKQNIHSFDILD